MGRRAKAGAAVAVLFAVAAGGVLLARSPDDVSTSQDLSEEVLPVQEAGGLAGDSRSAAFVDLPDTGLPAPQTRQDWCGGAGLGDAAPIAQTLAHNVDSSDLSPSTTLGEWVKRNDAVILASVWRFEKLGDNPGHSPGDPVTLHINNIDVLAGDMEDVPAGLRLVLPSGSPVGVGGTPVARMPENVAILVAINSGSVDQDGIARWMADPEGPFVSCWPGFSSAGHEPEWATSYRSLDGLLEDLLVLPSGKTTTVQLELEHAKQLWEAAGITNYELTVSSGSNWSGGQYTATIRDGAVVSFTVTEDSFDFREDQVFTVRELLDQMDGLEPRSIDATYDPATGAPTEMYFDQREWIDEEFGWRILSIVPA